MLPFDVCIERVEAALKFGIDPSLAVIEALADELGHPELCYRCLQVAGTNGKTSTSRYTAALLRACGLRCGLYTSPHLVSYVERVEVDGVPVDEEAFARGVSWALAAWRRLTARDDEAARHGCTEFELLTAAAFVMYALAGVDAVVLEVGLGGRWDATSAAATCASTVTGIGLDHMGVLGDTLGAIAREKSFVIRAGNPCVLGTNAVRPREVLDVMLERCGSQRVTPTLVVDADDVPAGLPPELPVARFHVEGVPAELGGRLRMGVEVRGVVPGGYGPAAADAFPHDVMVDAVYEGIELVAPVYQAQNIACALALATLAIGEAIPNDVACRAIAACPVPGRFEVVRREPLAILDACHNPQSAEAFAAAAQGVWPRREDRPTLLLGALADKDHAGIVGIVAPLFDDIVVTQSDSGRALPAALLAQEVREQTGVDPLVFEDSAHALAFLAQKPFICCGTITLIGELAGLLG